MDYFLNKVVCITGSSKGIGKETALTLGTYGAKLVINGRSAESLSKTESLLKSKNIECLAVTGDVSKKEDCKRLINQTIEKYGCLNILINNAGLSCKGRFADMTPEAWESIIKINTLGSIYPTTFALPHLLKTKGHAIFISSIGGKLGLPGHSGYSVSKMPLTSLVKALNFEHKKSDLHVGIVYVGFTENELEKTIIDEKGEPVPLDPRKGFQLAKREDVAKAIAKLIVKRKAAVTLSLLGKLQAFSIRFMPFIVNGMLKGAIKNFDKMYQK